MTQKYPKSDPVVALELSQSTLKETQEYSRNDPELTSIVTLEYLQIYFRVPLKWSQSTLKEESRLPSNRTPEYPKVTPE